MTKITFIDSIGRTILAEEVSRTETKLVVKNPAVYVINQQQDDRGNVVGLNVQLIPMIAVQLLQPASAKDGAVWEYNLSTVTIGNFQVDSRILQQHTDVFNPVPVQARQTVAADDANVVKLFDE